MHGEFVPVQWHAGQSADNLTPGGPGSCAVCARVGETPWLGESRGSLNLVGQSAMDCCVEAVYFFGYVQTLYTFFSASTSGWMIISDSLSKGCLVPKSLSGTQWSANAEAVNAVVLGYPNILEVLESKNQQQEKMQRS